MGSQSGQACVGGRLMGLLITESIFQSSLTEGAGCPQLGIYGGTLCTFLIGNCLEAFFGGVGCQEPPHVTYLPQHVLHLKG